MPDDNPLKKRLNAVPIPPELGERSRLGVMQAAREKRASRLRGRSRSKRRTAAVLAAAAILILTALLMNHTKVWASIQKALQFVPGIGVVEEENAEAERYVLKQPITVETGGGRILITGFQSDANMTYITMAGSNARQFESVTLINEQGATFQVSRSMATWGGSEWNASFWQKGKLDLKGHIVMRLPVNPDIDVQVTLERAKSVGSYADLGETVTANGLPITLIADRQGDKALISMVTPPRADYRMLDYGIDGVYMHDERLKLHVADDTGKEAAIEKIPGLSSPADKFDFPLSAQASGYTVTLPEVSATYDDEVDIRVPTAANERLNQTFEIAGFPVTITKVERTAGDPNGIRLYLDLHYDEHAPASLYDFSVDALSSMAKLDEKTGAIVYMEFQAEPGSRYVKLKLVRPHVVIRGPWTFHIKAEQLQGVQRASQASE
ncbi:hypothetical protein GXP70_01655 [Paenibacillus lycopersici]|uniref:DUF4179 domain-containing protein n=1 Tax=Paenibacillus lycopersici TaxID=2704462 RepID=A0A6C0FTM9_9BACL|nr:hypothetical protein [Paenibacillus lycopersici]QHT58811.1 hypothetical protein GXP70_01655 [Paenibacillus lycopersici]